MRYHSLESFPNIDSIWEGTTSILADDFARAIKGADSSAMFVVLDTFVQAALDRVHQKYSAHAQQLLVEWSKLQAWLVESSAEMLIYQGRKVLTRVQTLVCAILLLVNASTTPSSRTEAIATRWLELNSWQTDLGQTQATCEEEEEVDQDRLIFLNTPQDQDSRTVRHKL